MRKLTLALLLVAMAGLTMPVAAELCTPDVVPGATLLLPYFEVDIDDPAGVSTLFSVNNASATAILAHATIWTDLSIPVLDFNIYLTGYDVQTISLRDIIVLGRIPRTASDGQDPSDTISPQGPFSQDINFASCNGQLPPPANIGALYIAHLQAALTGQFSPLIGRCSGQDLGDNIARGYVTLDTVNSCNLQFPGDAGYFGDGGSGLATNQNVLWGDYAFVNPGQNFAQGDVLVHIEANSVAFVPGDHTFYGRYVVGTAVDNREPLPSTYGIRYNDGGAFDGGTDAIVWRDSNRPQTTGFSCGGAPSWFPLGQTQILAFDEQEEPFEATGCNVSPCPGGTTPFPAEAQRVEVGSDILPVGDDFGWLYLNLNTAVAGSPFADNYAQAFVSTVMDASGRFSVGWQGVAFNNGCDPLSDVIIGN